MKNNTELKVIINRYDEIMKDLSSININNFNKPFLKTMFFKSDGNINKEHIITCISSDKSYAMYRLFKLYSYECMDENFPCDVVSIEDLGRKLLNPNSMRYFMLGISFIYTLPTINNKYILLKELLFLLIEYDIVLWDKGESINKEMIYDTWKTRVIQNISDQDKNITDIHQNESNIGEVLIQIKV